VHNIVVLFRGYSWLPAWRSNNITAPSQKPSTPLGGTQSRSLRSQRSICLVECTLSIGVCTVAQRLLGVTDERPQVPFDSGKMSSHLDAEILVQASNSTGKYIVLNLSTITSFFLSKACSISVGHGCQPLFDQPSKDDHPAIISQGASHDGIQPDESASFDGISSFQQLSAPPSPAKPKRMGHSYVNHQPSPFT